MKTQEEIAEAQAKRKAEDEKREKRQKWFEKTTIKLSVLLCSIQIVYYYTYGEFIARLIPLQWGLIIILSLTLMGDLIFSFFL